MAKGYLISAYHAVLDPDKFAAYAKLAGPALEGAGGTFLVRGGQVTAFEHGLAERVVVVEFPSYEAALAAHESDDYQAALAALDGGVERDMRIVEGVD